MKGWGVRVIGVALIIAAISGLLFNLAGLYLVWQYKPKLEQDVTGTLLLLDDALSTTSEGLLIAQQSLDSTIESIDALESTIRATSDTLDVSTPILNTLSTMAGEDLPTAIYDAQTSLASAQQSAKIIDNVLGALAVLPGVNYDPDVPLNVALQQVSASLDPLPESLVTMQDNIDQATDNLEVIQSDLDLIAENVSGISTSLDAADTVIDEYSLLVADIQMRSERFRQNLPTWFNLGAWLLTIMLIWIAILQLGMLVQGYDLASRARE